MDDFHLLLNKKTRKEENQTGKHLSLLRRRLPLIIWLLSTTFGEVHLQSVNNPFVTVLLQAA